MLFGALIPLVPAYVDDFDLSKLQAGLLVGAFGAGAVLGGIPGGIVAGRVGPKNAVISGLLLLALRDLRAGARGLSGNGRHRPLPPGALECTDVGRRALLGGRLHAAALRGQLLGTVFGIAVLGAILGPMVGAVAKLVGLRAGFAGIGVIALLLAVAAFLQPRPGVEVVERGAVRRAFADPAFVAGLWLNALPALFFGVLDVLAPLALDAGGYGAVAIGAVFLVAGLIETALNPLLGRLSDRRGRLLPIRWALGASIVVGILLAFADTPAAIAVLAIAGALSFGGFYTPGIALVSDRAEIAALAQGLAFGVMNTAWAAGALVGPTARRGLADLLGDAAPYLLCSFLCAAHARDDHRADAVAAACDRMSEPSAEPPGRESLERPGRVERTPAVVLAARRARSSACADPSAAATRRDRSGCGRRSGRSPRRTTSARTVAVHAAANASSSSPAASSSSRAAPSRRSCSAVCSAIVRSRTMYGSGPPSAER